MRLRNMLKICLVFWESEPQYAYKRYAYKKNMYFIFLPHTVAFLVIWERKNWNKKIKKKCALHEAKVVRARTRTI